jgi:uncharacterized protein GlcG (DUF336 family)
MKIGKSVSLAAALATAATLAACAPATLAQAQSSGIVQEASISLLLANEAAMAAVARCRADGYRVAVAVIDRGGTVKALVRDDGAGLHTIGSAERKAYTSLTFRIPTSTFAERVAQTAALANFEGVLALPGGLPLQSGNEVVGAIGVGGAPTGAADAVCAQAGIDKIKDRL